ncbi:cilia- and flagella-associated protein 157-like [Penaeus japonicus]|uniref:cilia- and flagella-associated protein 157-like n=1 Tax=Penaeus japonicus TaxID=27405 RepID=UPI001C70E0EA|nr:cilia- and flagella-associated protein 157-like [Penaeus japonicus]
MAPKGGKKGGKKKGGKKKDKKEDEDEKPKEEISELDKHYYLNQISALEVKLKRSTTRCDQLDDAEKHARTQYDKLQQDKTDIIKFLKDRLTSKTDEVEELRSRLTGLVKAKQAEKEQYEDRLTKLGKDAENTRLDLNDQIIALSRKLESLEEFRQHKEELEAKLKGLEKELAENKEKNQEQVSVLEKASLVEAAALRTELEARVSKITEDLRLAAQTEVHSTTRRALHENEALTRTLDIFRERVAALRAENQEMRETLTESQVREALLQDTVRRVTARGERRARLLQAVTDRAEQHAHVWRDYHRLARENERLRTDLQVMQAQLDAATQTTRDLRERTAEKDIALDLTASHLQQEDVARRAMQDTIKSALSLLHHAAFQEGESGDSDNVAAILQQLVNLLTAAEFSHIPGNQDSDHPNASSDSVAPSKADQRNHASESGDQGEGQFRYRSGDLGFLPRPPKKTKPQRQDS